MEQVLSLLGFAQKAGKIVSGDQVTLEKLKNRRVKLIIVATDAVESTKQKLISRAESANVTWVELGTKLQLGLAVGKSPRAVVGILDYGFAKRIKQLIDGSW